MKQGIFLVLLLLVSISLFADVIVEGRAIIPNAENNEGIKVFFFDSKTELLVDSVITSETGYYGTMLNDGEYNIIYVKGELYNELKNIELYSSPFIRKRKIDNVKLDRVINNEVKQKILHIEKRFVNTHIKGIKYPYELELLKSAGKDLKRYSTLTYIGWGIALVGSVVIISSRGDEAIAFGTVLTILGGFASLMAPAQVGNAGRKLEALAKYKFLELEKKQKVENKSKD